MSQPTQEASEGAAGAPWAARDRTNLIEELAAVSLASDYSTSPADPAPSRRRQRMVVAVLALALAGFVLALGMSTRLRTAPAVDDQKRALRERIASQEERHEELAPQVLALRAEVEVARNQELLTILGGAQLADSVRDLELVTGYLPVTGPGARVTLQDAPEEGDEDDLDRVLDSDVQDAVNGLWQAGAEAIAVNGQRLSARSAIRSAAGAILVNYRPLTPPYQVEAIGPPALLDSFEEGPDAAALRAVAQEFGIGFSTEAVGALSLAAATTALPELAEPVEQVEPGAPTEPGAQTEPGGGADR